MDSFNFLLFIGYFILSVSLPFYCKELQNYSNLPFYNSFLLTLIYSILSFLLSWATAGPLPISNFITPPIRSLWMIILLSLIHAFSISLTLLSFSVSPVDCAVYYSLSGVIFDAILEFAYFRQKMPIIGFFGLLIVIVGICLTSFNFNWPKKYNFSYQIAIHILAAFFTSFSNVLQVRTTLALSQLFEYITIPIVRYWKQLFSIIPLFVMVIFLDSPNVRNSPSIFESNFLILLFFGVAVISILDVVGNILSETTGFAFSEPFSKLRILPTMLICSSSSSSVLTYCSTLCSSDFTFMQIFSMFLTIAGVVIYSLSVDKKTRMFSNESESDTVALLNRSENMLNQTILDEA